MEKLSELLFNFNLCKQIKREPVLKLALFVLKNSNQYYLKRNTFEHTVIKTEYP
ncbi:hypothetical protein FEM21_19420 [Flavobacterium seoulense]|uniref:Uncharacterized protein n=1 Tax=Flavobacterium seoulense TaxID=1492738 RepID=A0A066WLP8_9FLAO|nr:hypothetical protein FEM21_19420 [Flavobacterium seoulense]